MAVFTPKRLSGPALLTSSTVPVYTVPVGKTAVIKQIILNNTSGAAASVTAHVVPNGGSVTTSNQIISSLSISSASQIIWSADIPLAAGDAIVLAAGTDNVITAITSGIEIS